MSKGFILFLLTEAVPTVPYEILKMEKKSGTDIWRIHAKSIKYRFVDGIPTLAKMQIS
jgi:DNA-binding PadR family transcriptional regulator